MESGIPKTNGRFSSRKATASCDLKSKIKEFETNFNSISLRLNEETQNLNDIEESFGTSDVQHIYKLPENEVDEIEQRVGKLNEMPEIINSHNLISRIEEKCGNILRKPDEITFANKA
ncbi:hypothetical protein NYZ99_19300 [Maribacter litopenaei]|uniref:Uncharacterized protein n=1 Tax=Maribacter litopenaei TaxID=2976127 RepID=A0ABY5Y842_9FLAO|nr:hypothetical protein [Maribacter litopenaei]UWX54864.1 hypothetical protein NYZ99_19300 [Maribacter litopenaei]